LLGGFFVALSVSQNLKHLIKEQWQVDVLQRIVLLLSLNFHGVAMEKRCYH
jgi:hypothetical protein